MSNQLKMSKLQSVIALRAQGWTFTRIGQELGIHRETVARHVRRHSKPSVAPPGSEVSKPTQALPGRSRNRRFQCLRRQLRIPSVVAIVSRCEQ